jgi:hypothetical protein
MGEMNKHTETNKQETKQTNTTTKTTPGSGTIKFQS